MSGRIPEYHLDEIRARLPIAAVIGRSVRLKRAGKNWTGCCPFHAERSPSFHVYPDHYHCFGCGAHGDVIGFVMQAEGLAFPEAAARCAAEAGITAGEGLAHREPPAPRPAPAPEPPRTLDLAQAHWRESIELTDAASLAPVYFDSRGLRPPDCPDLRFHCSAWRDREHGPRGPALVSLMRDPITAEPVGVHLTHIRPDGRGKAEGPAPKVMLGRSGLIMLTRSIDVSEGLGICEGLETGCAILQRLGWAPIWVCTSAGGVARFPVLRGVECITAFADADTPGMNAAKECTQRWADAGREAHILVPPAGDWDDATTSQVAE